MSGPARNAEAVAGSVRQQPSRATSAAAAEMYPRAVTSLPGLEAPPADGDNITDWCLERFRERYGGGIGKDAIWEYLYGVMHAPDWRERYRHDLQRGLPRVPLADDFETFRSAGRELMDLHIGYNAVAEWPVRCEVDGRPDEGGSEPCAYRIESKMRWARANNGRDADRTVLEVNSRCRLMDIPAEAHHYTVSGRTPLDWAIDSIRRKRDKASGIVDDPNGWHEWADDPFELIRHLRRLVTVSVETARIVGGLPPSLQPRERL